MKVLVKTIVFVLGVTPALAQNKSLSEVRSAFNIQEGTYKLKPGQPDNCLDGKYELVEGGKDIVSLKVAGGLIAQNLQDAVANYNEKGCSTTFKTESYEGGFKNVESLVCDKGNISFTRTLVMRFSDSGLKYKLSSVREIEKKKSKIVCELQKVTE